MAGGLEAGLEKVGYLVSGAASQFQISQPILAGASAQLANTGKRQPNICWTKGKASHSILMSSHSWPKSNRKNLQDTVSS